LPTVDSALVHAQAAVDAVLAVASPVA
jgi:hypothetical protein